MKYLILSIALSFSLNSFSQTWNWWSDGYISGSGAGTFFNVDNQGTDMVISGLINDWASCQIPNECVHLGIDNQQSEGIQHEYHFSFSKPVDVRFDIDKINKGGPCYKDYLSFTGAPEFSNQLNISVSGNDIIPLNSHPIDGFVTVSYNSVTDFTITHGEGVSCNPGYIFFHKLNFEFNSTSTSDSQPLENILLFPNPAQNQFSIENNHNASIDTKLLNAYGKSLNEQTISPNSTIFFNTSNYSQGIYFILFQKNGRLIESKKLILQR